MQNPKQMSEERLCNIRIVFSGKLKASNKVFNAEFGLTVQLERWKKFA